MCKEVFWKANFGRLSANQACNPSLMWKEAFWKLWKGRKTGSLHILLDRRPWVKIWHCYGSRCCPLPIADSLGSSFLGSRSIGQRKSMILESCLYPSSIGLCSCLPRTQIEIVPRGGPTLRASRGSLLHTDMRVLSRGSVLVSRKHGAYPTYDACR